MTAQIVMAGDTARVRRSDPLTSHEAADSNDIHGAREEVLWYLSIEPLADHELVERFYADYRISGFNQLRYTPQRLRTARKELVDMGRVEATGIYRLTATGGRANVWQIKEVDA